MAKLLEWKEDGDMAIGNMIVVIISIFTFIVLMLAYASWHAQLSERDNVELIVNSYVQAMEASGCLTEVQQEQLLKELEECGMTEIDLTGTTMIAAGYGEQVVLCVSGMLNMDFSEPVFDSNGIRFVPVSRNIEITRSGTAYR